MPLVVMANGSKTMENNSLEEGMKDLAKLVAEKKQKEDKEPKRYTRFDFMSPEEYQHWVDEHQ